MTRVAARPLPSEPASPPGGEMVAGMRLGRYELLCPIAEGGMARVWAAEQTGDLGFRKLIAVKTIRPDYANDASFRAMFLDEAQLASRIRHANVVEVLDLGIEGSVVYQAMTLVEGTALSGWMRVLQGRRLPTGVALRIAIDMLRGLHAAHELKDDEGNELGLVHRDVSPQNVLVGTDGVAKLADFGIAKAFGRATEETVAGDVKGKLGYVAPEQLSGLPAAPQSDLFSAGVVLWETLTGRRLFRVVGDDPAARRAMRLRDPREVAADIPESVAEITMRALVEDPFARYPSSLAMADALEEVIRREGLDATHGHVAARLQLDVGAQIEEQRERLRVARRANTGSIQASARGRVPTGPQPRPPPSPPPPKNDPHGETVPFLHHPVERVAVGEPLRETMTDTVTVAEAPPVAPYFAAQRPRRSTFEATLPFLFAALLIALLIGVLVRVSSSREPAPRDADITAAQPQPQPQAPAAPESVALPMPLPPAAAPVSTLVPAVDLDPPAAPASAAPPVRRPPLPHGRTRVVGKPVPAPATATAAPRFESPY